jgi:hypothetical protein
MKVYFYFSLILFDRFSRICFNPDVLRMNYCYSITGSIETRGVETVLVKTMHTITCLHTFVSMAALSQFPPCKHQYMRLILLLFCYLACRLSFPFAG